MVNIKLTYEVAIKKIHSLNKFGMKLGLGRIQKLLSLLSDPQDKLKCIHVAGTNGKGSTCNMLSSILTNAGYKTGLFISPYVIDFRERMQINNEMISKADVVNLVKTIMPVVEKMAIDKEQVTEFEFITAMAFKYFLDNNCDIVILEVGLGGRYDSTNVIKNPLACVITSVSYDHMDILGDTLEKIAFEKCGIIKNKVDTILYKDQAREVIDTVKKVCAKRDSRLILADDSKIKISNEEIDYTYVKYKNLYMKIPLVGVHQVKNVSVVLETVYNLKDKGFKIYDENIINGIENTKFPARIELLNKKPIIILDGSHNPSGVMALSKFIKLHIKNKKIIGIVGMLKDKDVNSSLRNIDKLFSMIITVTINNERTMKSDDLKNIVANYCDNVYSISNINDALDYAYNQMDDDTAIIIFGSLYLAANARNIIIKKFNIK